MSNEKQNTAGCPKVTIRESFFGERMILVSMIGDPAEPGMQDYVAITPLYHFPGIGFVTMGQRGHHGQNRAGCKGVMNWIEVSDSPSAGFNISPKEREERIAMAIGASAVTVDFRGCGINGRRIDVNKAINGLAAHCFRGVDKASVVAACYSVAAKADGSPWSNIVPTQRGAQLVNALLCEYTPMEIALALPPHWRNKWGELCRALHGCREIEGASRGQKKKAYNTLKTMALHLNLNLEDVVAEIGERLANAA